MVIREESADSTLSAPPAFKAGATFFSIELTGELAPGAEITITVRYSDADLAATGEDPGLLALSRYDEDTHEWVILPTTVDAEARTLTATTTQLSTWTILGRPPSSSSLPFIVGGVLGGLVLLGVASFLRRLFGRR